MSDKIREEFENWLKKETGFDKARTKFPMTEPEQQQYLNHNTNLAWLAWQASRKAIKVELPDRGIDFVTAYYECEDVHNMLTAAGISYD